MDTVNLPLGIRIGMFIGGALVALGLVTHLSDENSVEPDEDLSTEEHF